MYKKSLLTALYSDYEDAATKYMSARNQDATDAERYLCRMKVIGKSIDYTQKMIDEVWKSPFQDGLKTTATNHK